MADHPTAPHSPASDPGFSKGPFTVDLSASTEQLNCKTSIQIPRRLYIGSRIAVLFFLIFVTAVCFVPWTQTVSVQGNLSAYYPTQRPQEIHAQIDGRIQKWMVNEGDLIKEGAPILELADINPEFLAPDLVHRLDQSLAALGKQKQAALERADILSDRLEEMGALAQAAVSSAEARVFEADNKVLNTEQRTVPAKGALETEKLNLERSRALEKKGLISRRELELSIQAVKEAEAEVKAAQASVREVQQNRRALEHDRKQINAELVQRMLDTKSKRASALGDAAKAAKEIADLELKRSNALQRQKASRIVAPYSGTVVSLTPIGQGETVKSGDLLFILAPLNSELAVEMWANAIDVPLLKEGRSVRLLFQGIPAIPIPAWPEFMAGTFDGTIQVVDQVAAQDGRFRIWVIPDIGRREWPSPLNVRQGTQVRGWVLLNRVPLWYEMWRRLNLFPADYEDGPVSLKDVLLPKAGRARK